jgi:uncharacterized protein YyaL (SSP411 family)
MNRLAKEKSPYLQQHARNPVDWYPWGEEAFALAKSRNKPVFLSIGYSTCHWCHVMAHESFEDEEIASLMNAAFVNIKVDREERPDIDSVYMSVCQRLTGSGGWPLTLILTPDKKPFFTGTYFPKENRHGQIGMRHLIKNIDSLWKNRQGELIKSADEIMATLQEQTTDDSGWQGEISLLQKAYEQLKETYDDFFGGFGREPKFPMPHNLIFLLHYWRRFQEDKALVMVEKTLRQMRDGGIFDHLGYGFHRYATDQTWLTPHFEKMLYDQALLAMAYMEAFQATGKSEYGQTAKEIFTYVLRDLKSAEGGIYSAEDADSEGVEGKFYLWSQKEILLLLDGDDADLFIKIFNIAKDGNYHDEATGRKTGDNILHTQKTLAQWAGIFNITENDLSLRLEKCRQKLFSAREQRIRPRRDDKILTDWNGLMIAALARGARIFNDPQYEAAACAAADFILVRMQDTQGRLLHSFRDGEAAIDAFLDDYAFLIWGLLDLYETNFAVKYLQAAIALNNYLLEHFWDHSRGGFNFSSNKHEQLLFPRKTIMDGAVPSGNSVAALNLIRLSKMTGNTDLEDKFTKIGQAFSGTVKSASSAVPLFLTALDMAIGPSLEVVITGPGNNENTKEMIRAAHRSFNPNKVILFIPDNEEKMEITKMAPFTGAMECIDGKATAYVCSANSCRKPTTDIAEMEQILERQLNAVR